jgi:hypothetical protein
MGDNSWVTANGEATFTALQYFTATQCFTAH